MKFPVTIKWLTLEEGGRTSGSPFALPEFKEYRANVRCLAENGWTIQLTRTNDCRFEAQFMCDEPRDWIFPGMVINVCEGHKLVAYVTVGNSDITKQKQNETTIS